MYSESKNIFTYCDKEYDTMWCCDISCFSIMLSSESELNFEVKTRTATRFLSLLLSCVALGSDTQGTYKEQNLLFGRHTRE